MSAVRDTSALRTLTGISARDASNTLRTIAAGFARDSSNVSRKVFSAFGGTTGAVASPSDVRGTGRSNNAIAVTTAPSTCTASGGAAPLTYAWTQTGGDPFTILYPTAASTAFTADSVSAGIPQAATFICTVTDAAGQTATSNIVTATARNLGGYA
ncbi:hypothetical protein [Sphingomonas oryzagri]|uniref:Ig-like domain-containing protein n=1 Tax=Sphingomonas oryzagri TaxID=3042314 RepID=A0ABT6N0Y1_9SPHN|nr:hypothetical protein [Sphingomonas oryzagri]MDH7638964.1 hypothetical protein [Sphingomonas oryzagri]